MASPRESLTRRHGTGGRATRAAEGRPKEHRMSAPSKQEIRKVVLASLLGANIDRLTTSFSTSNIRYNTVCTEIITTIHNRQPTLESAISLNWNTFINLLIVIISFVNSLA